MTIPGIGMIVELALIAAIGNIERFARPEQLVGYLGLNSSVRQSGPGPAYHGRITKATLAPLAPTSWLSTAVSSCPSRSASWCSDRQFRTILRSRNSSQLAGPLERRLKEGGAGGPPSPPGLENRLRRGHWRDTADVRGARILRKVPGSGEGSHYLGSMPQHRAR